MICTKCSNPGVENQAGGKTFWYCRTCKDEIMAEEPMSDLTMKYYGSLTQGSANPSVGHTPSGVAYPHQTQAASAGPLGAPHTWVTLMAGTKCANCGFWLNGISIPPCPGKPAVSFTTASVAAYLDHALDALRYSSNPFEGLLQDEVEQDPAELELELALQQSKDAFWGGHAFEDAFNNIAADVARDIAAMDEEEVYTSDLVRCSYDAKTEVYTVLGTFVGKRRHLGANRSCLSLFGYNLKETHLSDGVFEMLFWSLDIYEDRHDVLPPGFQWMLEDEE